MNISGRWFLPGPAEVHPDVLAAMLRPAFHHRSDQAREMLQRMQPRLRTIFRTTQPVLMQSGAAIAMAEGAIRNGVRDRVLCIISGTFGERLADIAERCDKEVIRLVVPRGQVLEADQLRLLLSGPPVDAVTLVHSESSTGALHPIDDLLPLLRTMSDAMIIVDAVGSIGATPIAMDQLGIDLLLAGSQKALGLPPGIALGVASSRFLERAAAAHDRGAYMDIVALHRAATNHQFSHAPAVPLVHALDVQLARIEQEGIAAREARHRQMRGQVETWVSTHGRYTFLAPAGRRSDTVSVLRVPPGQSSSALVARLAARGWTLAAGMDVERDEVIRIGHLGDTLPAHLAGLLEELGET